MPVVTRRRCKPGADVEAEPQRCLEECDKSSSESNSETSCTDDATSQVAPVLNLLERRSRNTSGRNSSVLVGKALEDDQTFWGHADFQDESSDSAVSFSSGVLEKNEDSSDSDFDQNDGESGDSTEEAVQTNRKMFNKRDVSEERANKKRRLLPPGVATGRAASKSGVTKGATHRSNTSRATDTGACSPSKPFVPVDNRVIRESTKKKRAEMEARTALRQEAASRTVRQQRKAPRLTQRQRLEEAVRTEEKNLQDLRAMRGWKDDTKQNSGWCRQRKRHTGPRTIFVSRLGADGEVVNSVEFIGCDLPDLFQNADKPMPAAKPCCGVTGMPARYRDPVLGIPFANAMAFAQIRARYDSTCTDTGNVLSRKA